MASANNNNINNNNSINENNTQIPKSARNNNKNIEIEYSEMDPLREDVEKQKKINKMTFKDTCFHILRNVTVEPTMFLFIIPAILIKLTSQNLSIEKACRVNLNYTPEVCDALRNQTLGMQNEYEREVQKLVAMALSLGTYINATLPCLLAVFVGSYSDITGHLKFFIMFPLTGQILVSLNGIIQTYFFTQLNLENFIYAEATIDGLTGSWCVCFMSIFAFISSATDDHNRTFRMGLVSFSLTVGFPIGMGIGGSMLKHFGFYVCYTVAGCLNLVNLLYTIFILKDPKRNAEQKMVSFF